MPRHFPGTTGQARETSQKRVLAWIGSQTHLSERNPGNSIQDLLHQAGEDRHDTACGSMQMEPLPVLV
jgi:hypothetical protein